MNDARATALRKAIDLLFTSLAEEQQERAIGIVLTGADHDGTVGLKAIKAAGGMVMAQAPETAQHRDMPESAVQTGLVDHILPIEEMAQTLTQYIDHSSLWGDAPGASGGPGENEQALKDIVALVRTRAGADFRGYKEGMVTRRANGACHSRGSKVWPLSGQHLQTHPEESRR